MASYDKMVEAITEAILTRRPIPPMPSLPSIADGYEFQKRVSAKINGEIPSGLKAGVTSKVEQEKFGLKTPLIASIYSRGVLPNGCEIVETANQNLECEIGVLVDGQGRPKGLIPIVEVVLLTFENPEDFSVPNAVAVNLGADRFILGKTYLWDDQADAFSINLSKEGQTIMSCSNDYSFGSPQQGVNWMVQEARSRGMWQDSEGDSIFLLGTCGQAQSAEPGHYCADFGVLGQINFSITASPIVAP